MARSIGFAKADVTLHPVDMYAPADIVLDKFIDSRTCDHTISIDLQALAKAFDDSTVLAKPIVIRIDANKADQAYLSGKGSPAHKLANDTFLALREVQVGATLRFKSGVGWLAYPAVGFLALMFGLTLVLLVVSPWQEEKMLRKKIESGNKVRSPDEVQARYDRSRLGGLKGLVILIPLILIAGVLPIGMREAERLWPNGNSPYVPASLAAGVALVGISRLAYWLTRGRKLRFDPDYPKFQEFRQNRAALVRPIRSVFFLFIPPIALALIFPAMPFIRHLPRFWRLFILFGNMVVSLAVTVYLIIRFNRKGRPRLGPGDFAYDTAQEMGRKANVRIRRVEVMPLEKCNAYVTVSGVMGVTKGFLEKCGPDEIRAVIAHEVGHMKAKHLRVMVPLSLLVGFGGIVLYDAVVLHFADHLSKATIEGLTGPIVYLVPGLLSTLILGGRRRRNEREADRIAVELTGDPELVIRALTKMTTLNEMPWRLKRSDEFMASHPSLVNRIAAIREMYPPKPGASTESAGASL
ncbi:MAG TPA: M48 family metallopeptidase [Fimbriimonadaceae bacterium]|nr:M48 family metallopeptidase [Fimbriimonadaceae bacterium]